LPAHL